MSIGSVALPFDARGEEPTVRAIALQWDAPADCPTREHFLHAVQRLSGPARESDDGLAIAVSLHRDRQAFALELELSAPDRQHRVLHDPDCATLVHAAAVVVSVALDPVAVATLAAGVDGDASPAIAGGVRTEGPPAPTPTPASALVLETPPATPSRRRRQAARARFFAIAAVGPGYGLTPRVTAVMHGELGLTLPNVRVGLVGTHAFASTRTLAEGVGIRARTSIAGPHVTWRPTTRVVAVGVGTGVMVGATTGGGVGPNVRGRTVTSAMLAWSVGVDLEWPPQRRFAVFLRAHALIGVLRPRIGLRNEGELHEVFRVQAVSALAVAGPMLRLP